MKKFKMIILITFFIVLVVCTGNRYFYGQWNPFNSPDRIKCYGRCYHISNNSPKKLVEKEKPSYLVNSSDILIGKKLYTLDPKGEFVPTVIYLDMGNDKYQEYALSGGP